MKRIVIALAVVIGLGLAGMGTSAAQAAVPVGFHISAGGVHVDVGGVRHGHYTVVAPGYYGGSYYSGSYYGGQYIWVPATYVRHGHHLQLVPAHWELRRAGHHHHGVHGLY